MRASWNRISGSEIEDAVLEGRPVEDLVQHCQAVYLWRRSFVPPDAAFVDPEATQVWIEELLRCPLAIVEARELSHFAVLERLELRGRGLTADKLESLRQLSVKKQPRQWLLRFANSLNQFSPPLYAGETGNVAKRARDHVLGETGFGSAVHASDYLRFSSLELYYYPLGQPEGDDLDPSEASKRRRTLLELLITDLSLCGYVARRG